MGNILVNSLFLRPGSVGGTEQYMSGLFAALARDEPDVAASITIAMGRDGRNVYAETLTPAAIVVPPRILRRGGRSTRLVAERSWLRRRARKADAVHHMGGTVPFRADRTAVTIYDPQFARHPEFFSRTKRRFLASSLPKAIARADLVCVMTDFVARELEELFDLDPDRARVVPPAIVSTPVPAPESLGRFEPARGAPFVLYPAVTWAHKNHGVLLDALADSPDSELHLVLTGSAGPADEAVRRHVASRGLEDRVHVLGRVGQAELSLLFSAAEALVFPSLYEGFGQPVVEAMAAGLPVIASRAGALPEVVADAGLLVDAADPSAWAAAMVEVRDDAVAARLRAAGLARAELWTGERAASAQADVYRELLA